MKSGNKGIILDRDGILIKLVGYDGKLRPPWSLDELSFTPYAKKAVDQLTKMGYSCHVATNQPDTDECSDEVLAAIHDNLLTYIPNLKSVLYSRDRGSYYYKPSPGMAELITLIHGLDPKRSWMIGDSWKDVVCGHLAGLRTILVTTDSYHWPKEQDLIKPTYHVRNLLEAVIYIRDKDAR